MEILRKSIQKVTFLNKAVIQIKNLLHLRPKFTTSEEYWINRYKKGGNSGAGSYNNLAEFKADVINDLVVEFNVKTVIEFGCGDGNQLRYFNFPSYIGCDISPFIIEKCKKDFQKDDSKQFFVVKDFNGQKADLTLSLDVLYHLVEDEVFDGYMKQLFDSSSQYVIIYSCDYEEDFDSSPHVKARKFTSWVDKNVKDFTLIRHIPNKFPFQKGEGMETSIADFYIYSKN